MKQPITPDEKAFSYLKAYGYEPKHSANESRMVDEAIRDTLRHCADICKQSGDARAAAVITTELESLSTDRRVKEMRANCGFKH